MSKESSTLKKISVTAVLCALAYLCMFVFRFKIQFLTFDFKDSVLTIISFLYGPLYGVAGALVVALTELVTVSDTGLYGFIMNFLSSAAFAAVCGLFYKYKRNLSGAIMGAVFAVLTMTAVMMLANIFVTPFYMKVPRSVVIDLLPVLILPFNLIKGAVNGAVTMIIYKPVTSAFKKMNLVSGGTKTKKGRFALLVGVSAVVIAAAVLVLLFLMNGEFLFFS